MARMFGTDGVRGVANVELTPELAFKLGYAAAKYFSREGTPNCSTPPLSSTKLWQTIPQWL